MGDDQHGRAHELSIKIYQHKTFPFEPFEISGKLAPGKPRRTDCAQASADCHVDSPRRPTTPAASIRMLGPAYAFSGPEPAPARAKGEEEAQPRRRLRGGGVVRGEPRPDGLHEGRRGVVRASAAQAVLPCLAAAAPAGCMDSARLPMKRLGGECGPCLDPRTVVGRSGAGRGRHHRTPELFQCKYNKHKMSI